MINKIKSYITNNVIGNALSLILAIIFFLFVANFDTVKLMVMNFTSIISPFLVGFGLAFILNGPINYISEKVFYKTKYKKGLSIVTTYILFFLIMIALCLAIIPQTVDTLRTILDGVPSFVESANILITDFLSTHDIDQSIMQEIYSLWQMLSSYITNIATTIISQVLSASISIGGIIVNLLTALIASIYMHISKDVLILQTKKIMYAFIEESYAKKIIEVGALSNKIFSKFLIGKTLDSAIIGIICFIAMLFIHPPFALIIAVIIGVTNMIPFFGPFIGAIPCSFILLMVSPMTTLIFIGFIIVLQQVDGNIIGPKILGDSTGLSAFWVLVSIIVGNGLFGIMGMLIGVPTFAVIYIVVGEVVRKRLNDKNINIDKIQ